MNVPAGASAPSPGPRRSRGWRACIAAGGLTILAVALPATGQVPHHTENEAALLYATHCRACHTEQVHWREGRRVKDWVSLVREVRRWQANLGLAWSEDEIRQVAHYLNVLHYRFAPPPPKVIARRPG